MTTPAPSIRSGATTLGPAVTANVRSSSDETSGTGLFGYVMAGLVAVAGVVAVVLIVRVVRRRISDNKRMDYDGRPSQEIVVFTPGGDRIL